MTDESLIPSLVALEAELKDRESCRWYRYFADDGPYDRRRYPKHMAFFAAGNSYRQRMFLAGNRTGKSDAAAYELTCHLTGLYPHWWVGKRFDTPIEAWASGDTANTTRNILQVAFLGPILTVESKQWCGMIPRRLIYDVTRKQGIPSAIQTIWVRHTTGGISTLDLLSYDQKREAFQGTAKHIILLDEEPPADIYAECLIRTMTTGGSVIVTMTPLMGLTPFVSEWLERSVLEVLNPDGQSELQQAKSAVFGRE